MSILDSNVYFIDLFVTGKKINIMVGRYASMLRKKIALGIKFPDIIFCILPYNMYHIICIF